MSGIENVETLAGAFAAGLVTSIHCAGMCGPLACSLVTLRAREGSREVATAAYHRGRMFSYAAFGLVLGAIGYIPLSLLFESPVVIVPWMLVVALVLTGMGLEKKLPKPKSLTRWLARLKFKLGALAPWKSGLALGLMTPILPCGPLYLMAGIALVSGSPLRGAELMLAFALGTVPLLWIAQGQLGRLSMKIGPRGLLIVQRVFALSAAGVLAWRLRGTLGIAGAAAGSCCP